MLIKNLTPDRLYRYWKRLLLVDSTVYNKFITASLIGFVSLLIYTARDYSADARLVPYVILVPTLLMLIGLLTIQSSKRLSNLIDTYITDDSIGMPEGTDEQKPTSDTEDRSQQVYEERIRMVTMTAWIVFLFSLVYVVGILIGTLVFLVLFYRFQSRLSFVRSIVYSVTIWLAVYIVFAVLLETPFYTGLLRLEIDLVII